MNRMILIFSTGVLLTGWQPVNAGPMTMGEKITLESGTQPMSVLDKNDNLHTLAMGR